VPELLSRGFIDSPRYVDGLDELDYHGDPVVGGSLSYSGAKALLDCPARYHHDREHGRPPKPAYDLGHLAHGMVLGVGLPVVVIDAKDWTTKAAKEARQAAYDDGAVPVLPADHARATAMAAAVRAHPFASALLSGGVAERSLFWADPRTGLNKRARIDWYRNPEPDAHLPAVLVDYKTTTDASLGAIRRTIAAYSYHQQDGWYREGVRVLGLDEAPRFVFVFQEKTAPYVVTVVELDAEARRIGEERNDRAVDLYLSCTASGVWPGYIDDIATLSLPGWAVHQHDEEQDA
jgi:hypothetical protein